MLFLLFLQDHHSRLWQWGPSSLGFWLLGVIIHVLGWKMNKQTWSPSYVFMMAGTCGIMLLFFYFIYDYPYLGNVRGTPAQRVRTGLQYLVGFAYSIDTSEDAARREGVASDTSDCDLLRAVLVTRWEPDIFLPSASLL